MRRKSLAALPAAVKSAPAVAKLQAPITDFVADVYLTKAAVKAVRTAIAILRPRIVYDLCTSESDSIIANRFSNQMVDLVYDQLWEWLHLSPSDGPRRTGNPDDEVDEWIEDALDDEGTPPVEPEIPAKPQPISTPATSVSQPPQRREALDCWAEMYEVTDRLQDPMTASLMRTSYPVGFMQCLPPTVGEAAVITPEAVSAPSGLRAYFASEIASTAKAYLYQAALAKGFARQRRSQRGEQERVIDDPHLRRFIELLEKERQAQNLSYEPCLPHVFQVADVQLRSDPPSLVCMEWQSYRHEPFHESDVAVIVHVSGWEDGVLPTTCRACGKPRACSHRATAIDEILSVLRDPASRVADELLPILRVPNWSRFIDTLDAGLSKATPTHEDDTRLIWEILHDNARPTLVIPVEQSRGKRGWTRGQRMNIDYLGFRPWLLRESIDRAAFEAITLTRETSYRHQSTPQLWRALTALSGCTHVFADTTRRQPVAVRKVRIALAIEPDENGFHLRVRLGPLDMQPRQLLAAAPDERHVMFMDLEHNRCLIAQLEPEIAALLRAMENFPVVLPSEALDQLVSRLPRLQTAMDLHLPEFVRGDRVDALASLVCRLEPLPDAGVRLDMVVRPIPGGPVFPPGDGSPELLHTHEGRRLHAVRDLNAERERAGHLVRELDLRDATTDGAWTWSVADDGVMLDLLRKLQSLSNLVEVEWPAGDIQVHGAGRGALKVEVHRRRDWFGAEGGIEVDGKLVPLAELLAAARAGRRYVRLSDRRFAELEEDLRSRLAALDDVVFETPDGIELGLLAAPVLADLVEDPRQLELVPAFRTTLNKLDAARTESPQIPADLGTDLRPYQADGFTWLARLASWGLGGCLADDMGLGKTVQTLALLLRRADLGPTLVIAPTSVVANWAAEAQRFAPGLTPHIYRGPDRIQLLKQLGPRDLLITSYAIAVRDGEALATQRFATLVIDEAQSVKNALTHRFRAVRDLQADFRLALTGTPIENHLGELWAIFRLVTPGLLGSWENFRQRFAVPIERYRDKARQAALARVVRPFLLRRTKAEVAPELPPRTEMNQIVELGPNERRLYESARAEILESMLKTAQAQKGPPGSEAQQRIKILAALTRLRLLCCHPTLVLKDGNGTSAKLTALVELLTELRDEGHRALVFSQFTSFLDLARPLIEKAGLRSVTLDGSTPAADREDRVRAFQAGLADVFLLSLRAGGTGLNLTAATYVIHLDPWWNPAVEDQATDRAHRIGQERPVTVIRMVARGTIEESVLSMHEEKRALAASILDGADTAAQLTSDDLLDLIRTGSLTSDEAEAEAEANDETDAGETP